MSQVGFVKQCEQFLFRPDLFVEAKGGKGLLEKTGLYFADIVFGVATLGLVHVGFAIKLYNSKENTGTNFLQKMGNIGAKNMYKGVEASEQSQLEQPTFDLDLNPPAESWKKAVVSSNLLSGSPKLSTGPIGRGISAFKEGLRVAIDNVNNPAYKGEEPQFYIKKAKELLEKAKQKGVDEDTIAQYRKELESRINLVEPTEQEKRIYGEELQSALRQVRDMAVGGRNLEGSIKIAQELLDKSVRMGLTPQETVEDQGFINEARKRLADTLFWGK
jgi:hypothetical protein